jgi:hypothetical protein
MALVTVQQVKANCVDRKLVTSAFWYLQVPQTLPLLALLPPQALATGASGACTKLADYNLSTYERQNGLKWPMAKPAEGCRNLS